MNVLPSPGSVTIALVPHDAGWAERFRDEERRVRAALGERVIVLEHVGSTSVPGLAAKPVLDLLLVVPRSDEESSYASGLEAAGYALRLREPEWYEHRLFRRTVEGAGLTVNLHVFSPGCDEVDRMLRFRDRLRADATDRELYERTKRELAARPWTSVQDYADAKSDVVRAILSRARPS